MKKKILFVCIGNSCRSQMSEGFAKSIGGNLLEVWSAGSRPAGEVNENAIAVMREKAIDISTYVSKGLNDLPSVEWDYLITMGCGDACPHISAKKRLDWALEDPVNKPIEAFRKTRDEVEKRINQLVSEIHA